MHSHVSAGPAGAFRWLDGYMVVISEVVRIYGDSKIDHMLAPVGNAGA
ncbi:hypothetical protein [Variovorax paradoxus]